MKHLTDIDKELIKARLEVGVPKTKIAKELGVSPLTIAYHTNPNMRTKFNQNSKIYNKKNPDKFFKAQFYSLMKRCLKEGWVSKQDISERIILIEQGLK